MTTRILSSASSRTIRIYTWGYATISNQSTEKHFFFAGGGTGGHLYPAIAVAEQLAGLEPKSRIHFFCSSRAIDKYILSQTSLDFTVLPAETFPRKPSQIVNFIKSFRESYKTAKAQITKNKNAVVIGLGGFVSGPVCLAAHKNKIPLALLNVDILPGKANKLIARWADEIFVQFEDTAEYFKKHKSKVHSLGCPLRTAFSDLQPEKAIKQLGLEKDKKVLLITGASSGSQSINEVICSLFGKLDNLADSWQIVHIAGRYNYEQLIKKYNNVQISHEVLDYFDDMPNLLACADLVIGRSGAVSVAEFAAASVPSICIPYPHHKDRHQYLNAGKLVEAGAAVIVDDLPDKNDFSEWLWEELEELMRDDEKRNSMADACKNLSHPNADLKIACMLIEAALEHN